MVHKCKISRKYHRANENDHLTKFNSIECHIGITILFFTHTEVRRVVSNNLRSVRDATLFPLGTEQDITFCQYSLSLLLYWLKDYRRRS
jgi:hypothetical protein